MLEAPEAGEQQVAQGLCHCSNTSQSWYISIVLRGQKANKLHLSCKTRPNHRCIARRSGIVAGQNGEWRNR